MVFLEDGFAGADAVKANAVTNATNLRHHDEDGLMAVEIKFDANQQFQRDAIDSVVDLFAGQEAVEQRSLHLGLGGAPGTLEGFQEVVFGNTLSLDPTTIETNLRRVQDRPCAAGRWDGSCAAIPRG